MKSRQRSLFSSTEVCSALLFEAFHLIVCSKPAAHRDRNASKLKVIKNAIIMALLIKEIGLYFFLVSVKFKTEMKIVNNMEISWV